MRNLTIKREKCFIGGLAKIKVYAETETDGDLTIKNVPCRKIGEIKNGEEKTFEIEDRATKIFVIADKASRNFCCEYYQIPEGSEDITLTGKCHFDFFAGNAFRFDNNDSEEVVSCRKKNRKRGAVIMAAVVAVCIVLGVFLGFYFAKLQISSDKTFSADGMQITLPGGFWKSDISPAYNAVYDSDTVAVFALKEPFSLLEGFENYTLDEYMNLVIKNNGVTSAEKGSEDGLTWFDYTYTNTSDGEIYRYFVYVYKTDDAFWTVQFALFDSDTAAYREQITTWAKSVRFNG